MVLAPLFARLVPGVGARLRLTVTPHPTRVPAVDLPAVTSTTDKEDRPTTRARRLPQTLHPTLAAGHAATDATRRWSDLLGNQ